MECVTLICYFCGKLFFCAATSTENDLFLLGVELARETDFENLVMRRLRQEEERKRLIQKMLEEEENS